MKFAIIGSGGREHAIVRALSAHQIFVFPGNAGMAQEAECFLNLESSLYVEKIKSLNVDCVVIGPENPLADGLADQLRSCGLKVFGPNQKLAELEASKIVAKQFMLRAQVPTAYFEVVQSTADILDKLDLFTPPYVLKADGLAAGKGVFILPDKQSLIKAAEQLFDQKILGPAGARALLEQHQAGYELSYLILTNGHSYESLPLAQDHKRLSNGDQGLNTGGMGTVAPIAIDRDLENQIHQKILKPTVDQLAKNGEIYNGVLFLGLMITDHGPSVLEYNVRFGDPETQVILPLLEGDWGQVFLDVASGIIKPLKWKNEASACVVLAAKGYPDHPIKDVEIDGDFISEEPKNYWLHAGTSLKNGKYVVAGGRVLNAIGLGLNVGEALEQAYHRSQMASWPGCQMRTDIGKLKK